MKYLNALLKGEEIPRHPREEEPLKPLKLVSEVLEGAHSRGMGEIERAPDPSPWPCPHCGKPAEIEEVCPSLDGTRMLTLWHCDPCQTYGVTPDTIQQPPVWVRKTFQ